MARVLIVAITKMQHPNLCIGAMDVDTLAYLRLFGAHGEKFTYENLPFSVGDLFELEYQYKRDLVPPHVEDVNVSFFEKIKNYKRKEVEKAIETNLAVPFYYGDPEVLFDGKILFNPNGKAYISKKRIPAHSICFWEIPSALRLLPGGERYALNSPKRDFSLKYVGLDAPMLEIPANSIVRISLARWVSEASNPEEKCYLQLSGCYIDKS